MPGGTQIAVAGAVILGAGGLLLASRKDNSDEKALRGGKTSIYWEEPQSQDDYGPRTVSGQRIAHQILESTKDDGSGGEKYREFVGKYNGDLKNFQIEEWLMRIIGIPYKAAKKLHDQFPVAPNGAPYRWVTLWSQVSYEEGLKEDALNTSLNRYLVALMLHLKEITIPSIRDQNTTTRFPATNALIEYLCEIELNKLHRAVRPPIFDTESLTSAYNELVSRGHNRLGKLGEVINGFLEEISQWDPEKNLPIAIELDFRRRLADSELPAPPDPTFVCPFDEPKCCMACAN